MRQARNDGLPGSRLRGALIAIFGVVCVSPDATLMRLIVARTGASNNLLVFYKSLIKIFLILGVIVWSKGFKEAYRGACRGPKFVLLASAAQALLEDASARERAGAAGRAVVQDNQGALERLLAGIARLLG